MCWFVLSGDEEVETGVSLGYDLELMPNPKMKATRCNNNEAMSGKRKNAPSRPSPLVLVTTHTQ